MPLLLGFLACEKVIFEEGTKNASLIGVLHDVYIPVIESIEVPPGTLIPFNWLAFTIWYALPEDAGIWHEQMVVLVGENDQPLMQSTPTRFQMEKQVMRATTPFVNFPVYKPWKCVLKLYTRNLGPLPPLVPASHVPTAQWTEMMTYPIEIHHTYYPA